MTIIFVKHEQTNSCNEDKNIEWRIFNSEEEVKIWEAEIKSKDLKWNYHTVGAKSMRYSSVEEFTATSLSESTLEDLMDMPMLMFVKAQELVKTLLF